MPDVTQADRLTGGRIAFLWCLSFIVLTLLHAPYLTLPYHWDEMGQFVPQALDLFNEGRWIPVHTLPNVHPPGVVALVTVIWKITGRPSIPAARILMLAVAAFAVTGSFLLAIRLSRKSPGAPAFTALLLLMASPLFYTQSMMVQLDMPAMAFSVWSLLFFVDRRFKASATVALIAVLMKETAVVLPCVLGGWLLLRENNRRDAAYYLAPLFALAAWIAILWQATGYPFGDPGFAQYNTTFSLHPVRFLWAQARRFYYLFLAEFRWLGTGALMWAWLKTDWLRTREWTVAAIFAALHTLAVSAFGGAVLNRYLLPVFPVLFAALGVAWMSLTGRWRVAIPGLAIIGSLLSMVWYPPYPFAFEDNLAMVDFVAIEKLAADYVATEPGIQTVATAWPLTDALRHPEFGYGGKPVQVVELVDFRPSSFAALVGRPVDALVVYSREWEPRFNLEHVGPVRALMEQYYNSAPHARTQQIELLSGLKSRLRWEYRGLWVEIYR